MKELSKARDCIARMNQPAWPKQASDSLSSSSRLLVGGPFCRLPPRDRERLFSRAAAASASCALAPAFAASASSEEASERDTASANVLRHMDSPFQTMCRRRCRRSGFPSEATSSSDKVKVIDMFSNLSAQFQSRCNSQNVSVWSHSAAS